MAHATSVSIDQMRERLVGMDTVRERLSRTEPLTTHSFPTGSNVQFRLEEGWHNAADEQFVNAYVRTADAQAGGTEYRMSKKAVLEAGALCGIPREHQQQIPAELLNAEVNWWFKHGLGDKQFSLLKLQDQVLGMCRSTIRPFSNLRLLDTALTGIERQYGTGEVLADYKFHHDMELTQLRLIVPGHQRVISGSRVADDTWSTGLNIRNSLIGLKAPEVSGYLFRWWCTNGCYDTMSAVTLARRQVREEDEAMDWAAGAVDEVLGGLEHTLDGVQALTSQPVEGEVSLVLRDLFTQHGVPNRERDRVLSQMADLGGELTMYDVQAAITQAANLDDLSPRSVDILLATGGHIAHGAADRCGTCRRIMPEGYTAPAAA